MTMTQEMAERWAYNVRIRRYLGKTEETSSVLAVVSELVSLNEQLDRAKTALTDSLAYVLKQDEEIKRLREQALSVDVLVDAFLSWELPQSVCSDPCVSMYEYPHERYGTSLLTAGEARQMFEHVLAPHASRKEGGR